MRTEAEALKSMCCTQMGRCTGSACMAWRWTSVPARGRNYCSDPNAEVEPARPAFMPASWTFIPCEDDAACWLEPEALRRPRRRGVCGMVPVEQTMTGGE